MEVQQFFDSNCRLIENILSTRSPPTSKTSTVKIKDIAKKLERHYNVTIINQNSKLADEKFYANFKNEPIEKVLSYINEIHNIQYTMKNNQIIIK